MPTRPTINLRVLRSARTVSPNYRTRLETSDDTTITDSAGGFSGVAAGNQYTSGDDTTIQADTEPATGFSGIVAGNRYTSGDDTTITDSAGGFSRAGVDSEAVRTPTPAETEEAIDFEPSDEVFVSTDEKPSLAIPEKIQEVDEDGFIVKGSVIAFKQQMSANTRQVGRKFQNLPTDKTIYILKTSFQADSLVDNNYGADTVITDYSAVFDGADVSYDATNSNLNYDESERAEIERKFWKTDRTNAVYDKLLNDDFNYSKLIEPPIVQTVQPEPVAINNFSFLSNISTGALQLQTGSATTTATTSFGATSTSTSGGGYS